ncbi:hypothetical protein C8R46DRAFT_1317498 [Mycena filopes]|nr:hypothetical protein C8R46DRAFT_1317498 [Mycena filopes]
MECVLNVPELAREIASRLDDTVHLSKFSQTNRFLNEAVASLLFRDICVPERALPALANRFLERPEFALQCTSLVIYGPQLGTDRRIEQPDYRRAPGPSPHILTSLSLILRQLSQQRRLERFAYKHFRGPLDLDVEAWQSLSSLGPHFQELSTDRMVWNEEAFYLAQTLLRSSGNFASGGHFRNLKILRLSCYHPSCAALEGFLGGLHVLEHLDLTAHTDLRLLPLDDPWTLTFASSHPRLTSLTLYISGMVPTPLDFLERHSTIKVLALDGILPFKFGDTTLPNLEALSITQSMILEWPALVSSTACRAIKHLRLINMPFFSSGMTAGIVQGMATSLTCVELDLDDFDTRWFMGMAEFLALVPNLLEFGMMTRPFDWAVTQTFEPKHLVGRVVFNLYLPSR